MSIRAKNPLRRAQLIAPFGCGAMVVVQGGISLITAGLDHWFEQEDSQGQVDIDEYVLSEWRLEDLLQVSHFRLPPDFRTVSLGANTVNTRLTIPFLRFPQWHFCPKCHLLLEVPLVRRGKVKCPECELNKKNALHVSSAVRRYVRPWPHPGFPMARMGAPVYSASMPDVSAAEING